MSKLNNVLVTRADLCQWLLNQGYRIVAIARHKDNPARSVFYFHRQAGIRQSMDEFLRTTENHIY